MPATRLFARAVVRVSPQDASEDAAGFLQGLLTNDVTGALPTYAALLTAQGKTMFDLIVWPWSEGGLLLDCEAAGQWSRESAADWWMQYGCPKKKALDAAALAEASC